MTLKGQEDTLQSTTARVPRLAKILPAKGLFTSLKPDELQSTTQLQIVGSFQLLVIYWSNFFFFFSREKSLEKVGSVSPAFSGLWGKPGGLCNSSM